MIVILCVELCREMVYMWQLLQLLHDTADQSSSLTVVGDDDQVNLRYSAVQLCCANSCCILLLLVLC